MWNGNHHYSLLQQGAGNYEDSEESDFSQESEVSQAGQGTEFSQEEHLKSLGHALLIETVGHKDLRLGQIVYILVFYNISFYWLLPLYGFHFFFVALQ